jgi:hypothetical protein
MVLAKMAAPRVFAQTTTRSRQGMGRSSRSLAESACRTVTSQGFSERFQAGSRVERQLVLRCRSGMKALSVTAIVALVLCASASAKFQISITGSDTTPAVGQPVTMIVHSERELDYNLRLIAVAPGRNIFRVVASITGDTSRPDPNIARNGFEVPLVRVAPDRWRGTVRFRSTGRWRVVVPNGAPVGVVMPAGVARLTIVVH